MDAAHRLVLIALADHANPEGRNAYPSAQRVADRLGLAPRSVRRSLAWLEEESVIVRGDATAVSHLPAGKRPVVWDLPLSSGVTVSSGVTRPSQVTGVTPRGDETVREGVTRPSPKPRTEHTPETTPQAPRTAADRPRALREPCPHGDPGGAEIHPKSKEPRCALCRTQHRAELARAKELAS